MGQITKIEVEYRRTVQPAQFESKSAAAIIGVGFSEDETPDPDAQLEAAFEMAVRHVHGQLGLEVKPAKKAVPKKAAGRNISDNLEDRVEEEPAKKPAKRGRPKGSTNKKKAEEPAAPEAREISDGELVKAMSTRVEALKNAGVEGAAQLGRELIASVKPDDHPDDMPWGLASIPEEQREDFLVRIAVMGK